MNYDIAVIGGGVIGLACAWRLAQRGVRVALFERGEIGREASWAAAGMLAPQCEMAHHAPEESDAREYSPRRAMFDLCLQSRDLYSSFAVELHQITGIDIELSLRGAPSDWREPGIRYITTREGDKTFAALQNNATPDARVLASENVNGFSSLWLPDEGQVENRHLTRALLAACEYSRVTLLPHRAALKVRRDGAHHTIETATETLHAEKILLCAGAWSDTISGWPRSESPRVFPMAGQMIALRAGQLLRNVIYASDVYLVPRRDGRVLAGATMEDNGFAKNLACDAAQTLLNAALRVAPQLNGCEIESHWAGLRPATSDGLPLLGAAPIENLFVATGHFRNGILLAPVTAEIMARCILDGEDAPPHFSPQRFEALCN